LTPTDRDLKTLPATFFLLATLSGLSMATATAMAFFYAPTEQVMGFVQKIFYFHVPSAWVMLLSAPLMAVGSVAYLWKRKPWADYLNDGAVELAILFGIMVLISGPLWGRKAWGVYWVWDVRLTSTLVLVMTLVACKIVRGYAGSGAAQIAAGLSILALFNAVFVYESVDLWRGTHPPKLISTLEPRMKATFWVSVAAFHLAYFTLLWLRMNLSRATAAASPIISHGGASR
jgi:heme exporter protein C